MNYLDTSFVVSLYSRDVNSTAAANVIRQAQGARLITSLVELETINAFELRVFRKEASRQEADASLRNFQQDLRAEVFEVRALAQPHFELARTLSQQLTARLGTRTADLLHVAAALELGAKSFFSFDLQQRKVAQSAGLKLSPMPKRP